jgi:signal transduction histidine kinase
LEPLDRATSEKHKAYLVADSADAFIRPIPIESERTVIGRTSENGNQVKINDRHISRQHACIHRQDGQYHIEDLDSRNGTFLNKERITRAPLQNHDKISIGRHRFLFLVQLESSGVPSQQPSKDDETASISISHAELDLSAVWAQNATGAAQGFLNRKVTASAEPEQPVPLAHQRLSLLYRLSENLNAAGQTGDVYAKGLELIMQAIPAAEFALIAQPAADDDGFHIEAIQLRDRPPSGGDAVPVSQTVFDWVFREKVALVSQDLGIDQRFQDSESIQVHDLRSIVCVPIAGKEEVFGLLYAQANKLLSPFNRDDAEFVSAVANEMALNIANIRLQRQMLRNARMAAIGLTVSNLAHNIKNLLAVNQTAIQLMDMHIREKDFTHIEKKWHWIKDSLEGISKLSTDLLAYAREDQPWTKPIDVNRAILSSRSIFEESTSRTGVQIAYALTPDDPTWPLDQEQLQQALLNLVLNAADALKDRPAGRILIGTAIGRSGELVISVTDDGCGIPDKNKGKVLDLFFTTKGSKGTGLGLPMVNKFVLKSGGELRFQSEEGQGTVFSMAFPPKDFP